uniref:dATP/dGTP pyrophosphohydrolase domain-containing protein n=1 Tax=Citrobacter freundii TaxID=546 RepID=UPI001FFE0F80
MTTNKLTDELVEDSELQMLIDSHEKGTAMFMRVDSYYLMAKELQERRKADSERKQVRSAHAEWSQATFGDVGPVGPLKHLSK